MRLQSEEVYWRAEYCDHCAAMASERDTHLREQVGASHNEQTQETRVILEVENNGRCGAGAKVFRTLMIGLYPIDMITKKKKILERRPCSDSKCSERLSSGYAMLNSVRVSINVPKLCLPKLA